jgi:hypothetical protein
MTTMLFCSFTFPETRKPKRLHPQIFSAEAALPADWLPSQKLPLLRAEFWHNEPAVNRSLRLLGIDVQFNLPYCGLYFDPVLLTFTILQGKDNLRRFLREVPGNFLNRYKDESLVTERIRRF